MLIKVILGIVAGLLITRVLHQIIYALPLNKALFKTPLHCGKCQAAHAGIMKVPWLGTLLSVGRCTQCGGRGSKTYLLIDLLSAPVVLAAILILEPFVALEMILAYSALVAIALIDVEHWIIPNKLLFIVLVAGLLRAAGNWDQILFQFSGVLPMLLLFGFIILIQIFYVKKPGLGMGDLKLAMALGIWLGPLLSMYAVFFATLFTLLLWVVQGIGSGYKLQRAIQFGPFIAITAMLFGIGRAFDPQIATHLLSMRF